ncbi:MAG: M3 family metallopeptidase [Acidobacteria bacterium]|nr:M3 family metallopeptidase [Acidobacteriota bacterium]
MTQLLHAVFIWSGLVMGSDVNPLMQAYHTPFGVPPFSDIRSEHFLPAFRAGIEANRKEVDAIAANPDPATFANTIEALEFAGADLQRVSNVFFNLRSSLTSPELNQIATEITPELTKLSDDLALNETLFKRVKDVYNARNSMSLNTEQMRLLENTYQGFVRGGANLAEDAKSQLRKLNEELALLQIAFQNNQLNDTNQWELVIERAEDLAGLPEGVVAAAAETATERGHTGKWVFTTHRPSFTPFMQFADNRSLREQMFHAYASVGNRNNENDNKGVVAKIASLRAKRAQLLGYPTHAHFVLDQNMAKTPEGVYGLLDQVWPAAIEKAKSEAKMMQEMINQSETPFQLKAWDWWYYAEKIRKEAFDFDEELTRPYFSVASTFEAACTVMNRLFGVTFTKNEKIPVYHKDVTAYEVREKNGDLVGIYYADYYVRPSKRAGAWMNSFRKQSKAQGDVKPIVVNCFNFPAPAGGKPTLLTFDQAATLFHEFGHAIHGLLSDCHYNSLSGTSVDRDFVEYPSQVMENWLGEREVLKMVARHYETGEPMPDQLIDRMKRAGTFNQGFATVEYLAASYLDMKWHTLSDLTEQDTLAFEKKTMDELGLIDEIIPRYRSTYFGHIFSGGYAAGYYSYIWAEILDADTFEVFREKGLFDSATAQSFRKHILSSGGTVEPMKLYQSFRGKEPSITPLLKRRGLDSATPTP